MKTQAASGKKTVPKKCSDLFRKRQEQIIHKATKLFMKKGYAQTTMREISKATGIDIRNIYYFIKSKEEILFLVFEMLHRPIYEHFERQEIAGIDDPEEQLRVVIREMIRTGCDYTDEIVLMYRESKSLPRRLLKIMMERESKGVAQIEAILQKGVERKVFDIDDTSFTANAILYQLSLYSLRHWNMKKYTKEQLVDLLSKIVMSMVKR